MKFKQRIFRYLIGVGIGVIISAVFFKDRAHLWTSWLPGNRVKDRLEAAYWLISPQADCQLQCVGLDIVGLKEDIKSAEVDFKNSEAREEPKQYQLVFPKGEHFRKLLVAVQDSTAEIIEVQPLLDCDCP